MSDDRQWWDADQHSGKRSKIRKGASGLLIGTTVIGGLVFTAAAALYAIWAPAWWLVVPMALLSTWTIVVYHRGYYRAEVANDYSRVGHLDDQSRHDVRISNTARAEGRKRAILWTMAITDVVALVATLVTVNRQSNGLGWVALFLWVLLSTIAAATIVGEN